MTPRDASRRDRRAYRQRKRAEQKDETRQRIVEALVELHRTVGPAKTSVSEVAELAGVGRMTVYNHFPSESEMIGACSAHWASANPLPDAAVWSQIREPSARLETALLEMYRYYRRSEDMLGNIFRDEPLIPALADVMEAAWWSRIDAMIEVLAQGRRLRGQRRTRFAAALRLALAFSTWRILGDALGDSEAASVAAAMVEASD